MKISLNTIKQYIDFELPPVDELVERINQRLGSVEKVTDLSEKYKDAIIVKVVSCEKHPNADKLSVCTIDDGGKVGDIPRDEQGHIQVVCGAPNVHADMFAIWLPPRSTVPASFDDKEPFVLDARELRGVVSQGMLAAADELALGTDHTGIIEINPDEWKPSKLDITPGVSFAQIYGLDDVSIELENKMFTHRPDCFGQIGVAREIAGILEQKFTSPAWYIDTPQFSDASGLEFKVENNAGEKVPRFMAVAIKDVTIKPSPLWLQIELIRLGGKPINNIVDVTNYVMLLTAQPTHAYDYDKLRGHMLGTRFARDGEKTTLLNGKTYELTADDIVIVDGEGIVGLGGVMGGGNSEVSDTTKNIVLECANFDMYTVRKTSMRHGIFTDAVTRFSKGQSSLQQPHIISLLMQSTFDVAGGEQASGMFDIAIEHMPAEKVMATPTFIIERLGQRIKNEEIKRLLGNVEFSIDEHELTTTESFASQLDDIGEVKERQFSEVAMYIAAPFWRTDIELLEDVVEEVGRLYGFDRLPRVLPERSIEPAPKNARFEIKRRIRQSLSRAGANEVLTYSFVHEHTMKKAEQDITQAFSLSNALSPDLQYYRLSVLPSLLEKVHPNIKSGHDEFVLFEIGKGHNKKYHADDDEGLPGELEFVDAVYTSKKPHEGAAYFQIRKLLSTLAAELGFTLKYVPITEEMDYPVTAPFDQKRSALVESRSGEFIGMIGELKASVLQKFKMPAYSAAITLDLSGLEKASAEKTYAPLSRFPAVTQDISLKVSDHVQYEDVFSLVWLVVNEHKPGECDVQLMPLSIYQSADTTAYKTITLRLVIASYDKTLTDQDVTQVLDTVAAAAKEKFDAERL